MRSLEDKYTEMLIGSHSIAKVKDVAALIHEKEQVQALINLCHPKYDYPTPEAAAWTVRHASFHLPEHHEFMATELFKTIDHIPRDSYVKNVLGLFKVIVIPEAMYGELTNCCMTFLTQPMRSKAILYYSLEIMTIICKKEPELSRELFMVVEEILPLMSDAFKRKFVKAKKQLTKKAA